MSEDVNNFYKICKYVKEFRRVSKDVIYFIGSKSIPIISGNFNNFEGFLNNVTDFQDLTGFKNIVSRIR